MPLSLPKTLSGPSVAISSVSAASVIDAYLVTAHYARAQDDSREDGDDRVSVIGVSERGEGGPWGIDRLLLNSDLRCESVPLMPPILPATARLRSFPPPLDNEPARREHRRHEHAEPEVAERRHRTLSRIGWDAGRPPCRDARFVGSATPAHTATGRRTRRRMYRAP